MRATPDKRGNMQRNISLNFSFPGRIRRRDAVEDAAKKIRKGINELKRKYPTIRPAKYERAILQRGFRAGIVGASPRIPRLLKTSSHREQRGGQFFSFEFILTWVVCQSVGHNI